VEGMCDHGFRARGMRVRPPCVALRQQQEADLDS
jgi:hypothetical protein